jgi:hypothetical protein
MRALLIAKIALDGGAAFAFAGNRHWPMALLFFGFAVADIGALWLA